MFIENQRGAVLVVVIVAMAALLTLGAVSYTHLDVYKRQVLALILARESPRVIQKSGMTTTTSILKRPWIR